MESTQFNGISSPLAHLTNPSSVLFSSISHHWNGVILEKHRIPSGERVETVAEKHLLWLWTSRYSGEYAIGRGHFAQCSKRAGTLTLTPSGVIPTLHSYIPSELTICALELGFIEDLLSEVDRRPASQPVIRPKFEDSTAARLMQLLMEELQAGSPSGTLYYESLAHALAVRFILLGNGLNNQEPYSRISELPPHRLRRVLDRIEENFNSDLSLASLAKETGYSRGHFAKMFHKTTGMTPYRYILDRRIHHAQLMLKRPEARLIDIALLCGFSSQAHFTSLFRKYVGVSPGYYRRHESNAKAYRSWQA